MMSLTPKQRLFVEYYLQSWNARESAERAGYGSPQKTGYRLLHNPGVVGVINERLTEIGLSTNEIIARMAQYARNNPAQFFVFGDVPA
ncbi:MAG: terminase small subunit, partial [Chloroflexi bacterium]|nr:terminase small subunit [Chloroflexota bacterium]